VRLRYRPIRSSASPTSSGIYKALQMLLPSSDAADEWIRKPNAGPLFNGASALDRLRAGKVADLFLVRQYLDAQRGGWS